MFTRYFPEYLRVNLSYHPRTSPTYNASRKATFSVTYDWTLVLSAVTVDECSGTILTIKEVRFFRKSGRLMGVDRQRYGRMSQVKQQRTNEAQNVAIRLGRNVLQGDLSIPESARGIVLFAHGSGSSRHSPRNQFVARTIRAAGVGTLLFDLLTKEEEEIDLRTAQLRFDIGLLAERLMGATEWTKRQRQLDRLRLGYFGSSTGGGAALVAAAQLGEQIGAVVSRGGRPDLAGDALPRVKAPTLLIVGGLDHPVVKLNEYAYALLRCEKELKIIPGATHLFEERGTLEQVAELAAVWFDRHLGERDERSTSEVRATVSGI